MPPAAAPTSISRQYYQVKDVNGSDPSM